MHVVCVNDVENGVHVEAVKAAILEIGESVQRRRKSDRVQTVRAWEQLNIGIQDAKVRSSDRAPTTDAAVALV